MNIIFAQEPLPQLTIVGVELGFGLGEPLLFTLRPDGLWITVVTDDAIWEALCEASQHSPDLGADWVRQNGEQVISRDWLTEFRITEAEQLEITAAPSVIQVQWREDGVFKA
ncbi:hypothetical protein QZQ97_17595 [Serratia sp. root2]|uniref:hypothetical protein n=1 Tax=Serratia sp. root2 TaxID=3059676 RepID=UPI0028922BC3|nr:hypothetical protein [Serratia sp. root2]MDT3252733.1 hypothetical protein [Serratia sp. root2]